MVVDLETFQALSPFSNKRVLCRCDDCGAERMVIKNNLVRASAGTYTRCFGCALIAKRGTKMSAEHRRKTGLASRGRKPSALHRALSRDRFSGSKNPRWNPDRELVARRERGRREASTLLNNTLKRLGTAKAASTVEMLGYSAEDLLRHIEAQFLPGMSWADRSAWHIDHKKPVAKFIAEGVTDLRIINALTNLQPLWKSDNCRKNATWIEPLSEAA